MHSYRANVVAFSGDFTRPLRTVVTPQAALTLPLTGGRETSRVDKFKIEGILSVDAAYTEVGGSFDKDHREHKSYAFSVIEGLNIAETIRAKRVVSRFFCTSPADGGKNGEYSFDISGSHFEDLTIAGHRVDVVLATKRFREYNTYSKLQTARRIGRVADLLPLSKVSDAQLRDLEQLEKKYQSLKGSGIQAKASRWHKQEDDDLYVYSAAGHLSPGDESAELKNFGGIIFVPNFGVIRLAQIRIEKSFWKLAMIRVEMGSPIKGWAEIGSSDVGGSFVAEVRVSHEARAKGKAQAKGKAPAKPAKVERETKPAEDVTKGTFRIKRPLITTSGSRDLPDFHASEQEVVYEGAEAGGGGGDGDAGDTGSAGSVPDDFRDVEVNAAEPEAFPQEEVTFGGPAAGAGGTPFAAETFVMKEEEAPPQPALTTIQATPQLEIRKELTPGTAYRMGLLVNQGPPAEGAKVDPVVVQVPADVREIPVQVWLDCSSHFKLEDMDTPEMITIQSDTGVSNEFGFTLRVIKSSAKPLMYVEAFFRHEGLPCGKIRRYLELVNGVLKWGNFVPPARVETEVLVPHTNAPAAVAIVLGAQAADICIEVRRTEANDGRQFKMRCYTPQRQDPPWSGPWNLPQIARDLVPAYFRAFMQARSAAARLDGLSGAGVQLWKALPEEVQGLLWDALEKGAATMLVVSEEPAIPWELMVPRKPGQPDRDPLGVGLQFGRWITGNYKAPPQGIPLRSGYIIAPKDSGLKKAPDELKFFTQELKPRLDPTIEVQPASYDGVNQALSGPARDVIHFICHGRSAEFQTLELNKPDTVDSNMVLTAKGFRKAFEKNPLAFLNACEVGRQVLSLDGVGGFAISFIEIGASAVIAPLWAVDDSVAYEVTRTFYTEALKGVPFAEIMKQIRAKAYDTAIDSYAAYCFYGDPMAKAVARSASPSDAPAGSSTGGT